MFCSVVHKYILYLYSYKRQKKKKVQKDATSTRTLKNKTIFNSYLQYKPLHHDLFKTKFLLFIYEQVNKYNLASIQAYTVKGRILVGQMPSSLHLQTTRSSAHKMMQKEQNDRNLSHPFISWIHSDILHTLLIVTV